jgi:hypothetical protein
MTEYKTDIEGQWKVIREWMLAYPSVNGVEISFSDLLYPASGSHSRVFSDDKLILKYIPGFEFQFTYFPPEKTMYTYEADLLSQITHLCEGYGGSWDTLTCYKFEYTGNNLLQISGSYFDNNNEIPYQVANYSYEGPLIDEVIQYVFHAGDTLWDYSWKVSNGYEDGFLTSVEYYRITGNTFSPYSEEHLEYDDYGNLILWERNNSINGKLHRSEYKYIPGEGNHAIVFPKESDPGQSWRCWYPYPVYHYSISESATDK